MVLRRLERLGLWLAAAVGGAGLMYAALTAPKDTAAPFLGVLLVLGVALLAVGIIGFAVEVVNFVNRVLPDPIPAPKATIPKRDPQPARPAARTPAPLPAPVPKTRPETPERVFVPPSVTPQFLNEFFDNRTDAQGQRSIASYLAKWMPIAGEVSNVQVFDTSAAVTLYLERPGRPARSISVGLWFPANAIDQVGLLGPGDPIAAVGRIARISAYDMQLRDCELIQSSTSAAISSQVHT